MNTEKVQFKVSSALKNLIGQELITNSFVAVFELVKNSFDAKAKNIDVVFDLQKNQIIISDDGNGMSKEEVINKWLFIGYSDKKKDDKAAYSGNKGIGRFSCDRLGEIVELSTIKDNIKTTIRINWKDFELDQSDEIQSVQLELNSFECKQPNGTTIRISNLKDDWTDGSIEQTKKQLLRLISPNIHDVTQNLNLIVISKLGLETRSEKLQNDVFQYMEDKTIFVRACFDQKNIVSELFDHGKRIVRNVSKNSTLIQNATIQVFFSDRNSKSVFKKRTGLDMVRYGNVFIYRNKFRVFPYGEEGFDIFGLAQRKTQGYNRYLGPREIIGWIDLFDYSNHFKESTSRDRGFIENIYYSDLKESYFEFVQRPLEKYVQLINYGNILVGDLLLTASNAVTDEIIDVFKTKDTQDIFIDKESILSLSNNKKIERLNDLELLSVSERRTVIQDAKTRLLNQEKEVEKAVQEKNKTEKENKQLKSEIDIKNRYFEVEKPARQSVLEHDLGLVVKKLYDSLEKLVEENKNIMNPVFEEELKNIAWAMSRTQGIRNFALKTKMDTKTDGPIDIGAFFEEYSRNLVDEDYDISLKIINEFNIVINVFDLITIFDNVFSNAKALAAKKIDVIVDNNSIEFYTDTYSEESNVDFNRVFDFGYSTTGGTGMGMYIIKQTCNDNNLNVLMGRFGNTNKVIMRIEYEKND